MRGFIFVSHFFNISPGLNFANGLLVDFSRGFIFGNLSFINVLYTLSFSSFALQLVAFESRNGSHINFSTFQIALFQYKRLNSRLKKFCWFWKTVFFLRRFNFTKWRIFWNFFRWIFCGDLISRICEKFAKIAEIFFVNDFSP